MYDLLIRFHTSLLLQGNHPNLPITIYAPSSLLQGNQPNLPIIIYALSALIQGNHTNHQLNLPISFQTQTWQLLQLTDFQVWFDKWNSRGRGTKVAIKRLLSRLNNAANLIYSILYVHPSPARSPSFLDKAKGNVADLWGRGIKVTARLHTVT